VPTVDYLKPHLLRKQALHGYVTSVGDGDNFRLFHTPGGRLAGWGWWRPIPQKRDALADQTIHVRIAGVDAPELAHFGRPAQPFGQDALEWLRASILHRYVRVVPYRRDQYDRVVGTVVLPWRLFRRDLGLEMLRAGMCTVYEAKQFSEFGGKEDLYRREEEKARGKGLGMWRQQQQQQQQQKLSGVVGKLLGKGGAATSYESPRDFKTRTKLEDTR
jgi:endonuclease YncB( thermonuclease family)